MKYPKVKYCGYYSINHGTTYNENGYEYGSLREARKSMRAIAIGSCPIKSVCVWWVEDRCYDIVARGEVKG